MLMSQIVSGKRYKSFEYIIAVVISAGMFIFLMGNHQANSSGHNNHPDHDKKSSYSLLDGLLILSMYLTFDSFTSNWQDRMYQSYHISSIQMMAAVNTYSILLTTTSLIHQNDLIPSLKVVLSSGQLSLDCLLISICSASGQLFIFHTISIFGPVIFSFIMTLRQAFAIILSCLIYGHPLNHLAIFGILIVFVALFSQFYIKCYYSNNRRIRNCGKIVNR